MDQRSHKCFNVFWVHAESFVVHYVLQLQVITGHPKIIEGANWHCYNSYLSSDFEKLNFVCRLQVNKVMGNFIPSRYIYYFIPSNFLTFCQFCCISIVLSLSNSVFRQEAEELRKCATMFKYLLVEFCDWDYYSIRASLALHLAQGIHAWTKNIQNATLWIWQHVIGIWHKRKFQCKVQGNKESNLIHSTKKRGGKKKSILHLPNDKIYQGWRAFFFFFFF